MIISHRGNLNGTDEWLENQPTYIKCAIGKGFFVEVDLWRKNDKLYLGHDKPQYLIEYEFLTQYCHTLWVHCKNIQAFEWLHTNKTTLQFFWHDKDAVTFTNKGCPWAFKDKPVQGGIVVCSGRLNIAEIDSLFLTFKILGICTDYPSYHKELFSKIG